MKTFYSCIVIISLVMISAGVSAQHKQYKLTDKRDTINIIDKNNFKQGRWVIHMDELRGEPGFEEEGMYKNGEKSGYWRKYNLNGDLLAVENYRLGGKDGLQQYYSFVGELIREESWRGYNPDAPYDTVAVYGTGSNEIVEYKIVKAAPYSVKNGPWRYYADGRIIKTEEWERNNIVVPNSAAVVASAEKTKPKKIEKTAAMLEWEKKIKVKRK